MSRYTLMNAAELSDAFNTLSNCRRPSSGQLRPMSAAVGNYRQLGKDMADPIDKFDQARNAFEQRVVRGHFGKDEWTEVTACAAVVAVQLATLTNV